MASMCAMVGFASWQAEQAATMGDLTSVGGCALHGAPRLQVATVAVQGCVVLRVKGGPGLHCLVAVPIFCVKYPAMLLAVIGPLTSMLQGLAAVQVQGAAGVQAVAPWVPLMALGNVALTFEVEKP